MKKLLLIALAVSGFAFVPGQCADAQVTVGVPGVGISFGFPGGYYAYPTRYNYYPYGYYRRPYRNRQSMNGFVDIADQRVS
jgi:hypothetical protein